METFLQLEASAAATNNNPLINLVRDMVSTLKKSAAALVSAPNADKLDPQTIVCKCKFLLSTTDGAGVAAVSILDKGR